MWIIGIYDQQQKMNQPLSRTPSEMLFRCERQMISQPETIGDPVDDATRFAFTCDKPDQFGTESEV